jgi:hypothetical protein
MRAKLMKAWRNQYCQDCGIQEGELVHVSPRNIQKEFRLCMRCFKKFFKNIECNFDIK